MKMLVNVEIPAIDHSYDMLIPDFLQISDVIPLVVEAAEEMSQHEYKASHKETLCYKEGECVLPIDYTIGECNIKNGDTLLLI